MAYDQTSNGVPQEMAALIALQRGIETGQVSPVTPRGDQTIADRLVGAAQQQMSPAVGQVAQQAGLAAQIQAMRLKQMQEAMMRQAAQETQQGMAAGGVASLNPNIRGFDEGGIVGYSGQESSLAISPEFGGGPAEQEEPRLYAPQENRRMTVAEMRAAGYPEEYIQNRLVMEGYVSKPKAAAPKAADQVQPPAPPAPPPPVDRAPRPTGPARPATPSQMSEVEKEIGALREASSYTPQLAKPEEGIEGTLERVRVRNEIARRLGLDPEMLTKQAQQMEDYYKRGEERLAQRKAELEERAPREKLIRRLIGMRGRGFGEAMAAGAERAMAYQDAVRQEAAGLEDLQMKMEGLRIDKVNTLKQLKYSTDMGEYDKAMQYRQRLLDIDAAQKKTEADASKAIIKARTDLAQIQEMAETRRAGIAQGAEAKVAGQLRDNMELMRKIESDVQNKYKTDKSIMAYEVLRMSGQPVPEPVAVAYEEKQKQIRDEVAARTGNVRAEVRRLQTQLYGRPLEDTMAPPAPITVQATRSQQAAFDKYK